MTRIAYEIQTGTYASSSFSSSAGSFTTYGFWLDEKPAYATPTPAYDNLLVSVPYSDTQLDFSRVAGQTYYPNGRDFSFRLRKLNATSAGAITADVASLVSWLTSLQGATIKDTWSGRVFEGCSVTSVNVSYYRDGWEATVDFSMHCVNARDVNGRL